MRLPGGVPTAHLDTLARSMLPPVETWPRFDYSPPHLRHIPDRVNCSVALLDSAVAAGFGDKIAFHHNAASWTYRHLLDRVERLARVLVEDFGVRPGDRVLLRSTNTPMVAACWLAVARVGAIVVNTMPLLRAREIAFILNKVQIKLALSEVSLAEELEAARPMAPSLAKTCYFTPGGTGDHPDAELDRRVETKPTGAGHVETAADDIALISFTSGTTGNPKAAAHFHRDVLAVCECWPQVHTVDRDEVVCGSPSLAFTFGAAVFFFYPLRYRATSVLVSKPAPDTLLDAMQRFKVTSLYAVPTMFNAMLDHVGKYDISTLRKCGCAGEHLRQKLYDNWLAATGRKLTNGIGSTEMLTHFISESLNVDRPGSTGRVVPGYEACVVDEAGNPLPAGERGRLGIRGPTGCRYLDDIERQKKAVVNGWTLTGDIFEQDGDGYFWYVDRSDDMIISSGYNISAQEVERAVLDHPEVAECAVIGVDDESRGKLVRACVVLRDPSRGGEDMIKSIQDFVKAQIAPYKYPREVKFLDELPKTMTGKIQRYRLREI